ISAGSVQIRRGCLNMEGVGARLGRSSTRYGPTTVFSGPVRKWKKKWIPVTPSNNHHHSQAVINGNSNGNNGAHLLLFKWAPITQSQNGSNGDGKSTVKDDAAAAAEDEPTRRKFKYIPIAVLEEQKSEAAEQTEDEAKPSEVDAEAGEPTSNASDEKPDINDVPMEENQAQEDIPVARQDLNESTLDLSLGMNAQDGENDSNSKSEQIKDGRLESANSGSVVT
ncbi:hypothetical protein RJ639_030923, partial [Escallonia herrerae]